MTAANAISLSVNRNVHGCFVRSPADGSTVDMSRSRTGSVPGAAEDSVIGRRSRSGDAASLCGDRNGRDQVVQMCDEVPPHIGSGLAEVHDRELTVGYDDRELTLEPVCCHRAGILRPQPPLAPVVEVVVEIVGRVVCDEGPSVLGPPRWQNAPTPTRSHRRDGTTLRSGRSRVQLRTRTMTRRTSPPHRNPEPPTNSGSLRQSSATSATPSNAATSPAICRVVSCWCRKIHASPTATAGYMEPATITGATGPR